MSNFIKNTFIKARMTVLSFAILLVSCHKLVDIAAPIGAISEQNVFTNDESAIAAVTGIYTSMSGTSSIFSGSESISFLAGLSADEFNLFGFVTNTKQIGYYTNALSVIAPIAGPETWIPFYNFVFRCNAAIKGLADPSAEALSPAVRNQLSGEARFMRAFFYFYLVNIYGEVPIALSTDPEINGLLSKSPVQDVYNLIIDDLLAAENLLSPNFLNNSFTGITVERVRPTSWAAKALLARAYLYIGEFAKAEEKATAIINHATLFRLPALNNVFLKNSNEAIWQLQPTDQLFNTKDARLFIIPATGPSTVFPVELSFELFTSFEAGDNRAKIGNWIDSMIYKPTSSTFDTVYYPYKYKINTSNTNITSATGTQNMTEYVMVLRLAEQYLIRAEARAKRNNISGARQDLFAIRDRAGLLAATLTANDQTSLLSVIAHERRVELFSEWGHRWFDLKRTGKIDEVMSPLVPIKSNGTNTWKSYQQLYPLPQTEIDKAPNLVQNPGYQ